MTCTSAEARVVCDRAAGSGKTVMVSYQRHQQTLYRWMKAFIAAGGLGELQFEGGALGSIAIVGQAPGIGGAVYEAVTITGSEAGLYYRVLGQPDNQPLLQLRRSGKTEPEPELPGEMPPSRDPDHAFIDVVLGRAANLAPPECGLRTIQLSEAAWRSAAAGGLPTPVEEG